MTLSPSRFITVAQGKHSSTTLAPQEFETDVVVDSVEIGAEGVAVLTLSGPGGKHLPTWAPGSHLDLILPNGQFKQYSLCSVPGDWHTWRLGVLLDENGSGVSRYIHHELRPGDVLRARGPRNHFPLSPAPQYLFIAGGIGITPILPMVHKVAAEGREWRLVYGGRTRSSMAFLDELTVYGDRVTIWPQDEKGLIELEKLLRGFSPEGLTYCCGPQPLLNAIEQHAATWAPKRLRMERFSAKPIDTSGDEPIEVHCELSGVTLQVPANESILSVAKSVGISTVSSCGEGICGTCETMVLEGTPLHRDSVLDQEEQEAGDSMMICVSRALSKRLVLDL
jgi:ferredoxin-NADP reductase